MCWRKGSCNLLFFFIYFKFYLFIHERHRERERDRSRLHAGSPMRDLIPGLQDYALG